MVVALLALFVALGGTGYAALILPANSVGAKQLKKRAVTGKKIRKNAVTSPKVKDFSLLATDFKAGELPAGSQGDRGEQGPPGPTFAATAMGSFQEQVFDPPASPDESSTEVTNGGRHFDFTLPTGGRVYVRFFIPLWTLQCTAGPAHFGLYLDGAPVPKSAHRLPNTEGPGAARESVVVTAAGAGAHSLEARSDCPSGNPAGFSTDNVPSWTVLLLGS